MRLSILLTVSVLLGSWLAAQEPKPDRASEEAILALLAKEKRLFAVALQKAKDELLKALDKKHDEVKGNKQLKLEVLVKQLDELEAEKKAFQEKDLLPMSANMKSAVGEYRTARAKAETNMKAAFETAATAYRNLGEVRTAAKLLVEMKEFLAKPKHFSTLFNGKDLTGWSVESGDVKQWSAEDGAIVANSPKPETKNYLLSKNEYSDFTLRLELKMETGCVGAIVLRAKEGEKFQIGNDLALCHPLFGLVDTGKFPGAIHFAAHWVKSDKGRKGRSDPVEKVESTPDRWQKVEITFRGDHGVVLVDGKKVHDLQGDPVEPKGVVPGLKRPKGKIGFEAHLGIIRYRNIEILELTPQPK